MNTEKNLNEITNEEEQEEEKSYLTMLWKGLIIAGVVFGILGTILGGWNFYSKIGKKELKAELVKKQDKEVTPTDEENNG